MCALLTCPRKSGLNIIRFHDVVYTAKITLFATGLETILIAIARFKKKEATNAQLKEQEDAET